MKSVEVPIAVELLAEWFKQCHHMHVSCTKGLPQDAKISHVAYDKDDRCVVLYFDVPDGMKTDPPGVLVPEFTSINCVFCN